MTTPAKQGSGGEQGAGRWNGVGGGELGLGMARCCKARLSQMTHTGRMDKHGAPSNKPYLALMLTPLIILKYGQCAHTHTHTTHVLL